jgi:hypothetical protein
MAQALNRQWSGNAEHHRTYATEKMVQIPTFESHDSSIKKRQPRVRHGPDSGLLLKTGIPDKR